MKFIVCDQNATDFEKLSSSIHQVSHQFPCFQNTTIVPYSFGADPLEISDEIDDVCVVTEVDFCNSDRLALARSLRSQYEELSIVICSSTNDYAMECYDLDIAYYLLKPVTEEAVRKMFERIARRRGVE